MAKAPGSTWVTKINHEDWPIVLANHGSVPSNFLESRQDCLHTAAIQLGVVKYVWVIKANLRKYDLNHDYLKGLRPFKRPEIQNADSDNTKKEKNRRKAFTEHAPLFEDDEYWVNYITNRSKEREQEMNKLRFKRQRKQSQPNRRNERSYSVTEVSDDDQPQMASPTVSLRGSVKRKRDESGLFLPQETPEPMQRNYSSLSQSDEEYASGSDYPAIARANRKARGISSSARGHIAYKRAAGGSSKQNTASKQHKPSQLIGPGIRESTESLPAKGSPLTPPASRDAWGEPSKPDVDHSQVILHDAEGQRTVNLARSGIALCQYLRNLETYDEQEGHHKIDLTQDKRALDQKLTARELQALTEFFQTNEIGPRIIPIDGIQFLSAPDSHPKTVEKHSITLSTAFVTATKLQHEPLQKLIYIKLTYLIPLPPLSILIIAQVLCKIPREERMRQTKLWDWLAKRVAEKFWVLVEIHTHRLRMILDENAELSKGLFSRLAGDVVSDPQEVED